MNNLKVVNIEPTPNPKARGFVLAEPLPVKTSRQFEDFKSAENDPLAKTLFDINGVETVFYGPRYVTVSLEGGIRWRDVEGPIIEGIQKMTPQDIPEEAAPQKRQPTGNELLDKINQVIDENIRPVLADEKGGLEVIDLDGYILSIHYQGACGGCASATQGTLMSIENLLKNMVDPRIKVVPV